MERANGRLQSEVERCKGSNHMQEDPHVNQLQAQADRMTAELGSLQTAHNTLRLLPVSEVVAQDLELCVADFTGGHRIELDHRSLLIFHNARVFQG